MVQDFFIWKKKIKFALALVCYIWYNTLIFNTIGAIQYVYFS